MTVLHHRSLLIESFSQMGSTKTVAVAESQQVVVDLNHDLPPHGSHVSG